MDEERPLSKLILATARLQVFKSPPLRQTKMAIAEVIIFKTLRNSNTNW